MNDSPKDPARATDVDEAILRACVSGDPSAATTLLLKTYGGQIFRYLCAQLRDEAVASDAFSLFAEDVFRGIASFEGRSSIRVWAFTIARRCSMRAKKFVQRGGVPVGGALEGVLDVAQAVRTATVEYLRTETKDRFMELRQQLSAEERELLTLRINEQLGWDDIARIQLAGRGEVTGEALKREAARLRKKFQYTREKLHALAESEGLLGDRDS